MRRDALRRLQRIFHLIGFIALAGIVLILAQTFGIGDLWDVRQGAVLAADEAAVILISGHAGHDSGAVCTDAGGATTLTEAEVNANVADLAAQQLRRAGVKVEVFEEYDPRLDGLKAGLMLSLHADSCINLSGYKAAYYAYSRIPTRGDRILACIDEKYAAATGLTKHPNTVTHNMTEYHAFRKIAPTTPAAILELGFLGGDGKLLTGHVAQAAKGVSNSVLCFLESKP